MQHLLNSTVCDYAHFGVSVDQQSRAAVAGTNITRTSLKSRPVRLRSTTRNSSLWLDVSVRLTLDQDEARFLAVESSYFGLKVAEGRELLGILEEDLVHYDFEREKGEYTEAHIQVFGRHARYEAYAEEVGAKNRFGRVHLPVGGRRLRPCLEDLIEALVAENLAEPRDGWQAVVDERRKDYRKKQIAALVRKHHLTAITELERLGYTVNKPKEPGLITTARKLLGLEPLPGGGKKRRK